MLSRVKTVAVVGLGKIGLPLAVQYASSGWDVLGADIDTELVEALNNGMNPLPNERGVTSGLLEAIEVGRFRATTSVAEAVQASSVVVVVVPLVVDADGSPDFRALDDVTSVIGQFARPGSLVVYETTLPIGTTRTRFAPRLLGVNGRLGRDLFVAFSPERVFSGRILDDLADYPKLVGGVDEASTAVAVAFYESVLNFRERQDLPRVNGVWPMANSDAAEFAKLAETTYRDVNIALSNEFALHAREIGIDYSEIVEACNSQPYSQLHRPGIAVGGHCIPVYPKFYLAGDPAAALVRSAREVNESIPRYAVDLLERQAGPVFGKAVLILGLAYRGGVREHAFSGALALNEELVRRGANPLVCDPLYSAAEIERLGLVPHRGEQVYAAIVQSDHDEYRSLNMPDVWGASVVLDGRDIVDEANFRGVQLLSLTRPIDADRRSHSV